MKLKNRLKHVFKCTLQESLSGTTAEQPGCLGKQEVDIYEATRVEKILLRFNIPREVIKMEGDHLPLPG